MDFFELNPYYPDSNIIRQVAQRIKNGETVIFPTDTIYALGCSIYNKKGIESICKALGKKPERSNLSIICNNLKEVSSFTVPYSTSVYKMLKQYLPGPFTFILKANSDVPKLFLNNKKTIGIRIPDNLISIALAEALGHPIVSSSIHSEDEIQEYLTEPTEIFEVFQLKADIILDGGAGSNEASTIIDCTSGSPILVRQGKGLL